MRSRRAFLGETFAVAALPSVGWSAAGAPTHLTAAKTPRGEHVLVGLRADGSAAFKVPLPARGHAAAAHPTNPVAVAFARRPGNYAVVIDCVSGRIAQRLKAPQGYHFYGHGAFAQDGRTLFTTENHITSGMGRIGLWDAAKGYMRLGDVPSGGIGPHEMLRLPGRDVLVVANGGIRTHPDRGRTKLNIDTMRPNLTHMTPDGNTIAVTELPTELQQNSIRHIAAFEDGRIAIAFQWQGDPYAPPSLAGLYRPGTGITLFPMTETALHGLDGYAGSVAVLGQNRMAVTFPRGGLMQIYDTESGLSQSIRKSDVCGVAGWENGGMATDGLGHVHALTTDGASMLSRHELAFDNHLVSI